MLVIYDYVAGALGGICGLFIGHPFDTVKVTLQLSGTKEGGPILQTIRHVAKGGLKNGIYRGLGFPLCFVAVQNSVFFGTYGLVLSTLTLNSPGAVEGSPTGDRGKNYLHVYAAGCLAGLAQVPLLCPPERIKVVLQSQIVNLAFVHKDDPTRHASAVGGGSRPGGPGVAEQRVYFYGPREASRWLYRRHGWRKAFYRGFSCAVARDTAAMGVYVASYEYIKDGLRARLGDGKRSEIVSTLVGGGAAGSLSWISVMPFDVLKNVYQSDITHAKYRNLRHCARRLCREFGPGVFYRGVLVVSLQALPVNAVVFLAYSQSLEALRSWHSAGGGTA